MSMSENQKSIADELITDVVKDEIKKLKVAASRLDETIDAVNEMHEDSTRKAHEWLFHLTFEGPLPFLQEQINSVYHQGRKDACRMMLRYLKGMDKTPPSKQLFDPEDLKNAFRIVT